MGRRHRAATPSLARRAQGHTRPGFTLVELLVAVSLMLVLAGIMVMFWPGMNESQRSAEGASALQGWLKIAKQRALRDQTPRGIRLYVNSSQAVEAQYIEQPDDFRGGTLTTNAAGTTVTITGPDLTGGQTVAALYQVQNGDYLDFKGKLYRITSDPTSNGSGGYSFTVAFAVNPAELVATSYDGIVRAPRVAADEKLTLPTGIAVDFATNATYSASPNFTGGNVDILFSPSGSVIRDQANIDIIYLWVRDVGLYPAATQIFEGEPTIIGVYVRSGLVAAYPPSPSGDPYQFVKAGGTTQ